MTRQLPRLDSSLFVFQQGSCNLYLWVYVDDIILRVDRLDTIARLISRLNKEFSIKDLSLIINFLGLKVTYIMVGFSKLSKICS